MWQPASCYPDCMLYEEGEQSAFILHRYGLYTDIFDLQVSVYKNIILCNTILLVQNQFEGHNISWTFYVRESDMR